MGGIVSKPKAPPAPPPIAPPPPMPVPDDVQVKAMAKRNAAKRLAMSGRESTMLTTRQSDKL